MVITNPGAILGIFAIIGSVSPVVGGLPTHIEVATLLAGLLGGMLYWWIGFAKLISSLRFKMTEACLDNINKLAALVLMVFGGVLIANVSYGLSAY